MTDGLNFVVGLEDRVSPGAKAAADSLRKLETELKSSKGDLATYQQQLTRANALGDVEGHRKYVALVGLARAETFRLQNALTALGPHAKTAAAEVEKAAASAQKLQAAEAKLQAASLDAADSFAGLAASLGPYASVAAVALGVTVGVASALAALAVEGIKTALSVNTVNARLTATFEALGDKPGQGQKTLDFLNKLSTQLPQSRLELAKWTQQFEAFGITDLGQLREQIRATASAQAIAGDEGASAYRKLAEKIQDAVQGHHKLKMGRDVLKDLALAGTNAADVAARLGLSITDFDAKLKSGAIDAQKFGNALSESLVSKGRGPLAAMGNELGVLEEKAVEVLGHLFDGIDTSPLTEAIKGIIAIGDQAQPSGKALHDGITGALQGIIKWTGRMLVEGEVAFLTLELYAVTHRKGLNLVADAFKMIGNEILMVTTALDFLLSGPGAQVGALVQALHGGFGSAPTGGGGKASAPAHAEGGIVGKPAVGEYFASVAPGEMILPQRQARELMGAGIGPGGRETMQAANTNGGGVQIGTLHLTIQAPNGVTDATSISATGLSLALERYQLASGR